jgi:membrane-associated protease RseP (regulator of RpoE activity)
MVGRSKDGSVLVIGTGTSSLWPLLCAAISPEGKARPSERSIGGSDHQPFIAAGIPAVHFFTGVHEDYHKPTDDVAKLSFPNTFEVAKMVFDAAAHLALMEGRPDFKEPPPHGAAPATQAASQPAGPRPFLGGIPSYEDTGGGVKLDGVTKGSPAEQAGLTKGDVLLELGGKKIDNIYDYQYALSERKPGDEVVLKVKRGDGLMFVKVKLGRRGE